MTASKDKSKSQSAPQEDRRLIEVSLGSSMSLKEFDYMDLDSCIERLQNLKSRYPGKTVVFQVQGVPYEDYDEYCLYERRPETDQEMSKRHHLEAKNRAQREASDLAQFEALKKRFGKGM